MSLSPTMKESSRFFPSLHFSDMSVLEASFQTFSYSMHSHGEFAIGVTLSGVQSFQCRGEKHDSTPGRIMIINPDEAHNGHAGVESGFSYRMMYVPQALMQSVTAELWGNPSRECYFPATLHHSEAFARRLCRITTVLTDPYSSALTVESLLMDTLAGLALKYGEVRKTPGKIQPDRKIVQDAMAIIRDNPAQDINLKELSGLFNRSPYSFLRLFRKTTGFPPHRYQIQCRLNRARRAIARGDSLVDAALESGFCDQSHLNRRFRQAYGITPGQYRHSLVRSYKKERSKACSLIQK